MMYLLFRYKNRNPSEFYDLPLGEKTIVSAFMEREIEDRIKEAESGEV